MTDTRDFAIKLSLSPQFKAEADKILARARDELSGAMMRHCTFTVAPAASDACESADEFEVNEYGSLVRRKSNLSKFGVAHLPSGGFAGEQIGSQVQEVAGDLDVIGCVDSLGHRQIENDILGARDSHREGDESMLPGHAGLLDGDNAHFDSTHSKISTVGCDKATVGAPGRGVESRPGCGSKVPS